MGTHYKTILYGQYRSSFKGSFRPADFQMIAGKLAPLLMKAVGDFSRDSLVVDLGCGAGELLYAFKECGFHRLSGCDISPEQVAVARKMFPQVQEQDIFGFMQSQNSGSVDIVTAFDVLEHFTKQETFDLLREIHRLLRPGGIFIAHCPNGVSPFVGAVYWGDLTHEWCPTPMSAESLCRATGFSNFCAEEHLAESQSLRGAVRRLAWSALRLGLSMTHFIETGKNQRIWTRNFAFWCRKAGK
jgi:SAM-dependent methyltransferase